METFYDTVFSYRLSKISKNNSTIILIIEIDILILLILLVSLQDKDLILTIHARKL